MSRYTYLLVDLSAVFIPFLFSFHYKIRFQKQWSAFLPALFLVAAFFIVWDVLFTKMGVWSFNQKYVLGIYIINIPIEEVLFFICIPYACVFTYHCIKLFREKSGNNSIRFSIPVIISLITGIVLHFPKYYTCVTFLLLVILIILNEIFLKQKWMESFYLSYLVLLIPFFICNGILTGTGLQEAVVQYNDNENMGIRLLTIPIEDVFYGMLLILLNITIYEYFARKYSRHAVFKRKNILQNQFK
jgi:lycopene cyclase domain-containing protein